MRFAFVDGAAFEFSVEPIFKDFGCAATEINWQQLTRNADRIFYFDSLPAKKPNQSESDFEYALRRKKDKLEFLRKIPNMHVREGVSRARKNYTGAALTQKGVDIALTVEVMSCVYNGIIDTARLFVNDLDFFPILEELTKTKTKSELFYVPNKTSAQLISAADVSEPVNHYMVHSSLPESIKAVVGIFHGGQSTDNFLTCRQGNTEFGVARLLIRQSDQTYLLMGPMAGANEISHMSRSKQLLIDHFEHCAKSKIVWQEDETTIP